MLFEEFIGRRAAVFVEVEVEDEATVGRFAGGARAAAVVGREDVEEEGVVPRLRY